MMDPYKALGLEHEADLKSIKEAYRILARKYHPDRHVRDSPEEQQQAASHFARVSEAYALLTNEERKAQYDHVYKYGGYENGPEDEVGQSSSPSRKRKLGVGYTFTDPFAFVWTGGSVSATKTVAGVSIPHRISDLAAIKLAFSSAHFVSQPSGVRIVSRTTEIASGRTSTRTKATTVYRDGRIENVVDESESIDQHVKGANGGTGKSWCESCSGMWNVLKDSFTVCHNPGTSVAY